MPFQYQPIDTSRSAATIAEIMQQQGAIRARQAEQVGAIQGQAAQQQGQAWAGAIQGVGNAVGGAIQQATDPRRKLEAQQLEAGGLQIGEQKRAIALRGALSQAITQTPMVDEGGVSVYDIPTITKNLPPEFRANADEVVKHLGGINEAFRQEQAAKLNVVVRGATSLLASGADPGLTLHFIDTIEKNGTFPKATLDQYRQFIQANPDKTEVVLQQFVQPQKAEVLKPGEQGFNPITHRPIPGMALPEDPSKGAYTGPDGLRYKADGTPVTGNVMKPQEAPKGYQHVDKLLDGKPTTLLLDPAPGGKIYDLNGQPIDNAASRVKPIPAASITIHNQNAQAPDLPAWALDDSRPTGPEANKLDPKVRMTPNGLYQAAMNYIASGQFPPTGRGSDPASVATRTAITSKVGAIAATAGMDEPALRAFYKSNSASLAQQQKMQDSVQGFMATADKNAALLQETLKKIPDTGIPIFNQPLRSFEQNVLGDKNLSQFATYLKSVQNEYARIVSQPNLAGQLTDSARNEAQTLLDPKATIPQMLGSIEALQKEGTNRLVSVGEQIQRIQQRMQIGPGGVTGAAPKSDPLGLFGPKK